MAFLGIPDHHRISKLHTVNVWLGNKSPPQPILRLSSYVVYVASLLRHAFPDFGSIGSSNEIQSNFAGSQTAIFKLLVSV